MFPAEVKVEINEEEIKQQIVQRLDDMIRESLIMIDVETLAKKMCMSKRFLEENFLHDPRMKLIERRKARKRFWFYQEAVEVITEIMNDW
ncbi:hypothetical protein [Sediminibacillus terrae]|uniref:hypothetical protein n=1 Tax=Sediminibacillus terrae TaxID=1562106 RepID=UPI0012960D27|nr:hypothetical protein [Sediminibacillus terrae]